MILNKIQDIYVKNDGDTIDGNLTVNGNLNTTGSVAFNSDKLTLQNQNIKMEIRNQNIQYIANDSVNYSIGFDQVDSSEFKLINNKEFGVFTINKPLGLGVQPDQQLDINGNLKMAF